MTTIITITGTVLPPGQTAVILTANSNLTVAALPTAYQYFTAPACSQSSTFAALPAAKPTPYYLAPFLQHHKHKERTASVGMYGLRLCSHVRPKRL